MEMDLLDKKLVYLLGRNARLSHASLARALQKSREVIKFRLDRLKKNQIIEGTTIDADISDNVRFTMLLKLRGATKQEIDELEEFLKKTVHFKRVQRTVGSKDAVINISLKNELQIGEIIDKIRSKFHSFTSIDVLKVVEEHESGWKSLIPDEVELPKIPSDRIAFTQVFEKRNESKNYNLDETDKKIIEELSKDARINVLDLARKTKKSHKTIISKIQKMIHENVIKGFEVKGDLLKIGLGRRIVFLKVLNERKNHKKMINFLHSLRQCSRFWKLEGPMQYGMNINVSSSKEFAQVLRQIREFLNQDLLEIETLELLDHLKIKGMFEE